MQQPSFQAAYYWRMSVSLIDAFQTGTGNGKTMSCALISNDSNKRHQPQLLSVCKTYNHNPESPNMLLTPEASKKNITHQHRKSANMISTNYWLIASFQLW
jgi:hypothetical protein